MKQFYSFVTELLTFASPLWVLKLVALMLVITTPSVVAAQEFEEDWSVEFHAGPVVAPTQVVGRGGTAIGFAEGAGTQIINPAAVANRFAYNGGQWFDWDWSLDWLLVGIRDTTDIANDGRTTSSDNSALLNAALNFVFGRLGVGLTMEIHNQSRACSTIDGQVLCRLEAVRALTGLNLGYNFLDGELILAAELLLPIGSYTQGQVVDGQLQQVVTDEMIGLGAHFGALWRPHGWPVRMGLTFRTPMNLEPDSDQSSGSIIQPQSIEIPWQIGVGAVYSFGPRELNPRPTFDEDQPAGHHYTTPMWREYWLIAIDLLLIGPVGKASGVAAWLDGEVQRSGREPDLSVRFGAEAEFWPRVMRARLGSYYEPSRFADRDGRFHLTGGMDIRLFELIWDWRFSFGTDWAPRYLNLMFSLGFWH